MKCRHKSVTKCELGALYSKDPRSLQNFAILSAPPVGDAVGFASTIDCCQSTSLTFPTTFADTGVVSPTHQWFRAFAKTHSRHVVLPFLEKLSAAHAQFFADNSSLRQCSVARPSPQSPVVRSERSKTAELLRFAFATTYRFTKPPTRTCQRLCRSAYERFFRPFVDPGYNSNREILLTGLTPA